MFTTYFPDTKRRSRILPWYLRNVLKCALRYGEALTTRDTSGILFALPPGHTSLSLWEYATTGFLFTPFVLGLGCYLRSMRCEGFVDRTQKEVMGAAPHYYLWGVAVDPEHQARGVGLALMSAFLARVDTERMPVYLETHDRNNVSYYGRHGFELVREAAMSKPDLRVWCMRREPAGGMQTGGANLG